MLATLALVIAIVAQSEGRMFTGSMYVPRIGEKAIMRTEDDKNNFIAFVDLPSMLEMEEKKKAYVDKHGPFVDEPAREAAQAATRALENSYVSSKKAVSLSSETGIVVLGYGNFDRLVDAVLRPKENTFYTPMPTVYLVKVADGPHQGKLAWVNRFSVVVPGAKPPTFANPPVADAVEDDEPKGRFGSRPTQPEDEPRQKITLIDTDWELDGNYTKVYGRVKNTTDRKISFLKATATFEDARNKLVRTEFTYVEPHTLEPGDVATIEIATKADPRIDHYGLKFEASDKDVPYNRPKK